MMQFLKKFNGLPIHNPSRNKECVAQKNGKRNFQKYPFNLTMLNSYSQQFLNESGSVRRLFEGLEHHISQPQ